jgi:AcrR family transcriptional regulator
MAQNSKINNKSIQDNVFKITETLLLKHGIKGWNMDSVALEAGISKNTLYEIINSKEQLIEDVVINRLRNNVETITEIFRDEPDFIRASETGTRHLAHTICEYDLLILPQVFREYQGKVRLYLSDTQHIDTQLFEPGQGGWGSQERCG